MLEHFVKWAKEINETSEEWNGYEARYSRDAFVVLNAAGTEAARVDYNDGRYDVSGADLSAVERITKLSSHR